jgi:hypothetical protein
MFVKPVFNLFVSGTIQIHVVISIKMLFLVEHCSIILAYIEKASCFFFSTLRVAVVTEFRSVSEYVRYSAVHVVEQIFINGLSYLQLKISHMFVKPVFNLSISGTIQIHIVVLIKMLFLVEHCSIILASIEKGFCFFVSTLRVAVVTEFRSVSEYVR